MNLLAYLHRQRAISKRRKQLKELNHWIFSLEDQVSSGQEALRRAHQKKAQLEAQLGLLIPADELVRMLGAP